MSRNPRNSLGGIGNQGDHPYSINSGSGRKGPPPPSLLPPNEMQRQTTSGYRKSSVGPGSAGPLSSSSTGRLNIGGPRPGDRGFDARFDYGHSSHSQGGPRVRDYPGPSHRRGEYPPMRGNDSGYPGPGGMRREYPVSGMRDHNQGYRDDRRPIGGPPMDRDDRRYPPYPRDYPPPPSRPSSDFYQSRPLSRNSDHHGFPAPRDFGPPRMRSPSYMRPSDGYNNGPRGAPMPDSRGPPPVPFSRPSLAPGGRAGPPPPDYRYHHGPRSGEYGGSGSRMDYQAGPGGNRYDSYSRPSMMDSYRGPSSSHHSSPSLMSSMGGSKRARSPSRYGSSGAAGHYSGNGGNPRSLLMSSRNSSNTSNRRADGVRLVDSTDSPPSLISSAKKSMSGLATGAEKGEENNRPMDRDHELNRAENQEEEDKSDSDASSFEQEEIEMEIERVDNAIAKQERILATARVKIAAAEKIAREKAEGIESQEKVRQRLLPDSIMEEYRARYLEHITDSPASTAQLIGDIYSANRKLARVFQEKSKERDMILFNIGNLDLTCGDDVKDALKKLEPPPPVTPLVHEYRLEFNPLVRPALLNHIRQKMFEVENEKEALIEEYREYEEKWAVRVEQLEAEMEKNGVSLPVKPFTVQPSISNIIGTSLLSPENMAINGTNPASSTLPITQPEESSQSIISANASTRTSRRSGFRSDVVRSEAEWQNALSFLGILPEENNTTTAKPFSSDKLAKEVEMVTDPDIIRQMKFKDYNNLVHDPEKELQDYNNLMDLKWSEYDKAIFKSKLMQYGKDFFKIASFMDQKSTHDCITYYYREKVNLRLKNLLRRSQSGRGRRKKDKNESDVTHPSFKTIILMDDEELVPPAFAHSDSEKSDNESNDQTAPNLDKRHIIIDPSSAPVSPLGSPSLVDQQNSNWTEEEMQRALRGFELFGRDFHSVSSMIGTKSPYQCKAFFNNHRRHVKEEKDVDKKQKESSLALKKKGKTGRKRTESFSNNQAISNNLGVEGLEELPSTESGSGNNEKKRKAENSSEALTKKSKKSDEAFLSIPGVIEGSDSQPRKTISYWSVSERADFLRLLPIHGKNFEAIAQDIQSKSAIQVRNYFHNSRKKLNLDSILEINGHERSRVDSISSIGGNSIENQHQSEYVAVSADLMTDSASFPISQYIPQAPSSAPTYITQNYPTAENNISSFPEEIQRSPTKNILPKVENLLIPNSSSSIAPPPLNYEYHETYGYHHYAPLVSSSEYKPSGPIKSEFVDSSNSFHETLRIQESRESIDSSTLPVINPEVPDDIPHGQDYAQIVSHEIEQTDAEAVPHEHDQPDSSLQDYGNTGSALRENENLDSLSSSTVPLSPRRAE